ncbi:unnamed protein product [Rotaria sordida]|uniref:Uncharacterized protein n=2 Tax=Rotaria sordida TaxID=392033 RepID=A0A819MAW4_9BILA|nr:unnamed protein product [Rotaria sordida]
MMNVQYQQDYVPNTLNSMNMDRCSYLPCFPFVRSTNNATRSLLLANVPIVSLSIQDLYRRYALNQDGPFISSVMAHEIHSYFYNLSENYFQQFKERLKVNVAILDFNLYRFQKILERYQSLQHLFDSYLTLVNRNNENYEVKNLDFHELRIGLEFFLQIDVDVFYMKTCMFRGAMPQSFDEGLFCKADYPLIRYSFLPCYQPQCPLCQRSNVIASSSSNTAPTSYVVEFNTYHSHRFQNGYTTILNCPATCQTKNIIYTVTCCCGNYEYIGSTSSNLSETIESIRETSNRFISETLLCASSSSIHDIIVNNNQDDFVSLDVNEKFRLYQHFIHCPQAIQLFLDQNLQYHAIIPITIEQTLINDRNYSTETTIQLDNSMEIWFQHLPIPPNGYRFCKRQHQQQYKFFKSLEKKIETNQKLYTPVDIYHVSIIAVLPEQCSTLLRQVIACLFSTHAETKLNRFNLCMMNTEHRFGPPHHSLWCQNIVRPTDEQIENSIRTIVCQ